MKCGRSYLWFLPLATGLVLLRAQQPPPPPNSYVDAKLCASCHPQIARTYALTGMARSFYRPDIHNTTPNSFHHEASDTWYAMLQRDGKLYQRRWRVGPSSQEVQAEELSVDYVMGSGNHVRTYLHRTTRGSLIELPLAWYAEQGGIWAMEPGRDRDYILPPRQIAYECMFCHNSYPRIPAKQAEPGSEPLYEGALPEGIDCQRCHGPGGNHVRAATQGLGPDAVRSAIVSPARLSPDRQMEVCMQCHLETTSQPIPHSIVRYQRAPFSYRPGEPIGNFEIFFDRADAPQRDDFEIAHSAYRLRKSQCFLQSAGKMTCTSCHNPHDIPRGEAAAQHYNDVCGQCHKQAIRAAVSAGKHPSAPNCIGCHMPKRRTDDVIHAVMTDHFIRRKPPAADPAAPIAERADFDTRQYHGEVVPYYPAPLAKTGENALYAAVAQVSEQSHLQAGLPRLAAEIGRQKPAEAAFYVELGQAWMSARKLDEALAAFEEAARRRPSSAVVALNLADALTEKGNAARAIAVLDRAIQEAPGDPLLRYQLGVTQTAAGHQPQAIAAFEKCVALDPGMAEAHNLLGAALAGAGDPERAHTELQAALRINPDLPDALGNFAHLLAARRELADAVYYFARAVKLKPDDAEIRTNYTVTLAGLGRFSEAREQIDAALKADPKSADAHNLKGSLLDREGDRKSALLEFLEAVRLRPAFGLAHLNAGKVLASQGDLSAAEQQFRQAAASGDENVQRQAAALLHQIGR